MAPRGCVISPDNFCFICGKYTVKSQQRNISDFLKKVYFAYFKLKLGDHDNKWAPHKVYRRCEEDLRLWFKGKKNSIRFGIPMMWHEQKNHSTDCYFCSVDVRGFKTKNKKNIFYPNFSSANRPVPHISEIPFPHPPSSLDDIRSDSEDGNTLPHQDESSSDFSVDEGPQPFSHSELNDLVRNLGLSKDGAELLGSRLKNKNLLTPGTSFSWYKHREKEFTQFFSKEGNLVFRNDVQGLMKCFDIEYDPSEWQIFIRLKQASKQSCCIMLSRTSFDSLWRLQNTNHVVWSAGRLHKICLLCLWDSQARDLHWTKTDWSLRGVLTPGEKNVINTTLVQPEKVLLPPLHIKLGIMKQFIKSLPKDGECFGYLCSKFPKLSEAKLKEGVFTGSDIRKLLSVPLCSETLRDKEKEEWNSFKEVVHRFWGNTKDPLYKTMVQCMLTAYEDKGCKVSLKVHFLHSNIDCFPEN
ncbi:hypothetical protein AVEN_123753-1 [Araneus ventricosus]|uniref:Uncharacterized protein n=1 Tax=Araneus ventricosus TaxID=182803 RepID=A0A4Y2BMT9_ARAVE|nr:hypothetical protein AVEN_123753-1 [Araneus ventricosus]